MIDEYVLKLQDDHAAAMRRIGSLEWQLLHNAATQPAPDAAEIRDAALREAVEACAKLNWNSNPSQCVDTITQLINRPAKSAPEMAK